MTKQLQTSQWNFYKKVILNFSGMKGGQNDKIHYWIKYKNQCVCFIAIKDPDEPDNRWAVWSDDICSEYLNDNSIDESLKQLVLRNVDECGYCGSCGGGQPKVIEHCELLVNGEGFLAVSEAKNLCDVEFVHKMKWETMTFNVFEMGSEESV